MTPGIYPGLSRIEYEGIEAVNWSSLSQGVRTAEHVHRAMCGDERADTPAMKFGRACHTAVLQPNLYLEQWKVLKGIKSTTKQGHITEIEDNTIRGMVTSLQRSLSTNDVETRSPKELLFCAGEREVTVVGEDPITGLPCKAMVDIVPERGLYFADLKTTTDASPRHFTRDLFTRNYHGQMAFTNFLLNQHKKGFLGGALVAVEKKRPYAWGVYTITGESLGLGTDLFRRLLNEYARQKNAGIWETYGTQEVIVPDYLKENNDGN